MGLADRDYMRGRQQHERASGPSDPSATSTLWIILFFVAFTFVSYKAVTWWQQRQVLKAVAAKRVTEQSQPPLPPRADSRLTGNWDPNRVVSPPAPRLDQQDQTTYVTKCVIKGGTTYSQGSCAPNANATTVKINRPQNIADSVPIPFPAPQAPRLVAQAGPEYPPAESPHVVRKRQCSAYDEAIKQIDARARQPISGGEQDWLAARRKEQRDAQFRMRC